MENKMKKSLLERYGIPVHHLDFKYIADCKDGREIEKIYHILTSNEEGYFPDLTKCAEDKLRKLKPESRLFRVEEKIRGREALAETELKPIYDWNQDIKTTDKKLQKLGVENNSPISDDLDLPPIRKSGKIVYDKKNTEKSTSVDSTNTNSNKKSERIKSTDYNKWDKYDPEEEILRMDLAEERVQDEVEFKNRINTEKYTKQPLTITEIFEEDIKEKDKLENLNEIEKEKLSEEFRLRGNEYFRAKEYENALTEYTRAIQANPKKAVAPYNNRALTYFKQQQFLEAIKDSEECLKLEPNNIKARLRLAEASYAYGRRRESYQLYINVLEVDPHNSVALKATSELRKLFEDLPPPHATRLRIQDESSKTKTETAKEIPKVMEVPKVKPKCVNYDLADLVKPNRMIKNNFIKTAENLGKKIQNTTNINKKNASDERENEEILTKPKMNISDIKEFPELLMPGRIRKSNSLKGKILIEEI